MTTPSLDTPFIPDGINSLEPFVNAGVVDEVDLSIVAALTRHYGELVDSLALVVAILGRAVRRRHTCILIAGWPQSTELGDEDADVFATLNPVIPDEAAVRDAIESSALVSHIAPGSDDEPSGPLVFDGIRLYFERQWRLERDVALTLAGALEEPRELSDATRADLAQFLKGDQYDAVLNALTRRVAIISGGPGTGKTKTIASMLVALNLPLGHIAVAAPTGKAAARIEESLSEELRRDAETRDVVSPGAVTLHRLLGMAPGVPPRYNQDNPLAADLVIVDESSMVDLNIFHHLLAALRPSARLILTGDPDQLASVEMGTVLSDLVGTIEERTNGSRPWNRTLTTTHRFSQDSAIGRLADSIRSGDQQEALSILVSGNRDLHFVEVEPGGSDNVVLEGLLGEIFDHCRGFIERCQAFEGSDSEYGEILAAARHLKIIAANRQGPRSVAWFQRIIEDHLAPTIGTRRTDGSFIGRPVLFTRNDYLHGIMNGDTGVTLRTNRGDLGILIDDPSGPRMIPATLANHFQTWWAMTIHKSQGSEFDRLVVSLPQESPLLTRELLYTGVTRARTELTVVCSVQAFRDAVGTRIERASGLGDQIRLRRA